MFKISNSNCEIISADLNKIYLKISDEEFNFCLEGFNENVPVKVSYKILKETDTEVE